MKRIWQGKRPLVIVEVDEDGNVKSKITIMPGEVIPDEAYKMIREADELHDIPYDEKYSDEDVKNYFKTKEKK